MEEMGTPQGLVSLHEVSLGCGQGSHNWSPHSERLGPSLLLPSPPFPHNLLRWIVVWDHTHVQLLDTGPEEPKAGDLSPDARA